MELKMQFTADERLQRHFEVAQDGDETGTRMPGECGEQVLKGQGKRYTGIE